ncbi:MAG: hypothetical protein QOI95_2251 [Acidimicrobiaceae bacterium]|jgi:hypothetical protein
MSTFRSPRSIKRLTALSAAFALTAGALLGLAERSDAKTNPAPPVVEVTVDAQAIHGPGSLPAGVTTFHTVSTHPGTDSLAVVRLDDDVTYDQIFGYLAVGDLGSVFQHVAGKGGVAHGGPHNGSAWTTELTPGNYLFADDEVNLVAPFEVTGDRQPAKKPSDDGKVIFEHGTFKLPKKFGSGTWELVNHDNIQHELGLLEIAPGHTQAEVEQAVANGDEPPFVTAVGTINAIGPGQSAWVTLSDIHGFYVIGDWLPMFQGAAPGPVVQFHTFS